MTGPARIGVVLAGGRATRMNGDKAGAVLAGETLLARAVATIRAAGLDPRVCARARTELPPVDGLESSAIWREPASSTGNDEAHPLAGLAYATRTAGEPIVAFPVDLPLLPAEVLRGLATHVGAAVLGTSGRPAALVARVEPADATALGQAAAAHAPALRTLVQLGAQVRELTDLAPTADPARALTNVNAPGDLVAVERLLRRD